MDERLSALIAALRDEETRGDELAGLDDEQIAGARAELHALFSSIRAGEVDGVDPRDVGTLTSIRDAIGVLAAEADRRTVAAAETDAEIEALEASLDETIEPETEPEAEAVEEVEPVQAATEPELVEPPAPVAAAIAPAPPARRDRRPLAELAARVPAVSRPRPGDMVARPRFQRVDGTPVEGMGEITERFAAALREFEGMGTPPGFKQKVSVIKMKTELREDFHVGASDDIVSTTRKIDAITEAAKDPASWSEEQQAIVASGGWCAPPESRYEIPSVVNAGRPVRDGLARISTSRGTINFVRAARLSTILANATGAAVTTWENTTDEVPGESTKTRQTHACRTIREEELGAVVARMRFGNFQQRAFPEDVAHDLELVMARHARVAETRLLDALIGDMNIDVTQTGLVGTSRDVKHHFAQAVSEMRYTERSASRVRAIISDVLLDMIPADIAMQQASGELDALLADEATARAILRSIRGFDYTVSLDVPTGADAFVTNSDNENLADWPDNFEIPFFFDGTAVFVDGGELDLGIIRDSTLNNTNDYEVFMETFEGLLWLGPYGKTLTLTTCPNGESQVATDENDNLCSGS